MSGSQFQNIYQLSTRANMQNIIKALKDTKQLAEAGRTKLQREMEALADEFEQKGLNPEYEPDPESVKKYKENLHKYF